MDYKSTKTVIKKMMSDSNKDRPTVVIMCGLRKTVMHATGLQSVPVVCKEANMNINCVQHGVAMLPSESLTRIQWFCMAQPRLTR